MLGTIGIGGRLATPPLRCAIEIQAATVSALPARSAFLAPHSFSPATRSYCFSPKIVPGSLAGERFDERFRVFLGVIHRVRMSLYHTRLERGPSPARHLGYTGGHFKIRATTCRTKTLSNCLAGFWSADLPSSRSRGAGRSDHRVSSNRRAQLLALLDHHDLNIPASTNHCYLYVVPLF